jgi:hypothetical protein
VVDGQRGALADLLSDGSGDDCMMTRHYLYMGSGVELGVSGVVVQRNSFSRGIQCPSTWDVRHWVCGVVLTLMSVCCPSHDSFVGSEIWGSGALIRVFSSQHRKKEVYYMAKKSAYMKSKKLEET